MQIFFPDRNSIIESCKKGNVKGFEQLYNTYHKKIFTICLRYFQDKEEAFALMNEIFIKIFEKIHLYKEEINFDGWVYRITVNTIIDYIRKNKNYKKNFITTEEFDMYGQPMEEDEDIDEWWEEATSIPPEELMKLINELPPATKTVFNMYAIDEYTHREIASKLGVSEGTSKWHLANARKILKQKISSLIEKNLQDEQKKSK